MDGEATLKNILRNVKSKQIKYFDLFCRISGWDGLSICFLKYLVSRVFCISTIA